MVILPLYTSNSYILLDILGILLQVYLMFSINFTQMKHIKNRSDPNQEPVDFKSNFGQL